MNIKPFAVEEWMNAYETGARYNIAETCVDSISLDELFELSGTHKESFLNKLCARRLTYGYIEGSPDLKKGIAALYHTIRPNEIVPAHGASGANHHVFYSLINPGDKVISIMPSYQQLYSIPASLGAKVEILHLKKENSYLPDLEELEEMARGGVKMICLNNPNNPTGALMSPEILKKVVDIAKKSDSYLLVDEVYRHLTQYSGHMSSLFFEEIYCFFLKKCNLNTPPGKLIFSNIFRRSIFLFQRYHYFVIGIQLMFIQ